MSEQNTTEIPDKPRKRRHKWLFLTLIILFSAIAGGFITKLTGSLFYKWHYAAWHGPISKATAEKRAGWLAAYISRKVNATPEQKKKLVNITKSLAVDLIPYREKFRSSRGEFHKIIVRDTVDREKIETFRAEKVALMDAMSKRVSLAFADASEVLNAEQRKKLTKRFFRHRYYER